MGFWGSGPDGAQHVGKAPAVRWERLGWHLRPQQVAAKILDGGTWVLAVELLFSDMRIFFFFFGFSGMRFFLREARSLQNQPRAVSAASPLDPVEIAASPLSSLPLHLPAALCFAPTRAPACIYYLFELAAL